MRLLPISFALSSGCVGGFAPSFTAGTVNPQAGAFSPFVLSFARSDSDQDLSGLTVTLPARRLGEACGCAAVLRRGHRATPARNSGAAELASPSCPAGSQVGTAETGAGPGGDPFFLPGKVYLTGPYKGGPVRSGGDRAGRRWPVGSRDGRGAPGAEHRSDGRARDGHERSVPDDPRRASRCDCGESTSISTAPTSR